jgi:hypothetical protein
VELSGLQSGVVYYYQIEADACSGQLASPIYSVKAPLAAGHQQEYQIYIYGDMGYTNAADTRYRLLEGISSVDFVYHVGDLAYADQWNYYLEGGYPVYPPNLGDETNSYTQSWYVLHTVLISTFSLHVASRIRSTALLTQLLSVWSEPFHSIRFFLL